MPVNGYAVASIGMGGILLWSALNNKKITQTIQDVLQGKQPVPGAVSFASVSGPGGTAANAPQAPATISKNVSLGKLLAAPFGWSTGQQWNSLYALWQRESGWNNHALNSSSGAYGIPQALPASKMGPAANPPISSAAAQIGWGLIYIRQRYGDPITAYAHEQANNWY
jgi:hypothetical protein